MSENNTSVNVSDAVDFSKLELEKDAAANERFYTVRDGKVRIVESQITREKSEFKGVTYFKLAFTEVGEALRHLGDDVVLDLLNAKIASQIGIRVTARIEAQIPERIEPDPTKGIAGETVEAYNARRKAKIAEIILSNPVVFSPEDALSYVPGERELSMAGIIRKIGKVMASGQAYFAARDYDRGSKCFDEVKELNNRLNAMMQKARDEATEQAEAAAV